jgi:hypothetical protein
MIANPFTYGNPISDSTRFFGRKREIEQVFSRLRNVEFESSSLVGERRIGKTSLLNYLAHPSVRHAHGLDADKHIFVYVDLQLVSRDMSPARLWQRLLRQMSRSFRDAEIKQLLAEIHAMEQIDAFALADVFDAVDEKEQYVVFLLDEFEHVTENQNFGPDFFYGLRSLAIHHHLALITSSRRELIDLCHSEEIRSSPFFNIFANITVRLFTQEEARSLITLSLDGTSIGFTDAELEMLFRSAGYHPYFLQAACHFLFEAYQHDTTAEERASFLNQAFRAEATPHLDDYWYNSTDQEKIVLTALALLRHQGKAGQRTFSLKQLQDLYSRSAQTLAHLEKRGLLVSEGESYSLFSSSFGDWIRSELTDTMHDRQSYDEWLQSNRPLTERLANKAKNDLGEILPRISDKYRELIITWVSDPKNLISAVTLLRTALGFL